MLHNRRQDEEHNCSDDEDETEDDETDAVDDCRSKHPVVMHLLMFVGLQT